MLSVDMFSMYACVKMSGAHTHYGAADKHTHTHVSVHRPAHLCRTPLRVAVYCFGPFAVRLSYCWRLEFCSSSVVRGARERDRWRGGVRRSEEEGGAGWSSAGQGHCVDDLLQLAPQSLSPRLLVPLQSRQDLVLVLDDVGVDLM